MKRLILWGIITFSIFSIIRDTNAWTGSCTIAPYVNIDNMSVSPNLQCVVGTGTINIGTGAVRAFTAWTNAGTAYWDITLYNYGMQGYCRNITSVWVTTVSSGTTQISCPTWALKLLWWDKGDKGDKGDIGNTGAIGHTGSSAFELAQLEWYSGTLSDWLYSLIWPQGATGTTTLQTEINFSGASFTGILMNNSVASGVLDQSWFYLPIAVSNNGTTYADFGWIRNLLILLGIFITMVYGIYYFFRKKWNSLNI